MILRNSGDQVDFFATLLIASSLTSLIFTIICVWAFHIQPALYFTALWAAIFLLVNRILRRKKLVPASCKAVLITGCDRGFGAQFANRMSGTGFQVFAGCRDQPGNVEVCPSVHRLQMDVTKPDDVQQALKYVKENLKGNVLWAVINNAGVSKGSDIEVTPMSKIQEVLNVNLLGAIRVTKAFLPLLKDSKGRVVNVASAAGRLLLPGFLPYSISKSALISFSDGLRLELRSYGIHVVSIEPWTYRTQLSDVSSISKEINSDWLACNSASSTHERAQKAARTLFSWGVSDDLDEVTDVVEDAITLAYPPYAYAPGKWYLNWMTFFLHFVPRPVVDFVFCHAVLNR